MNKPKIIAYLKPTCGWSQGVRAIMRKYDLPFEDRDIINDPLQRQEMIEKSGQMLSPCVEVNGHMLADISGEEVEAYLLSNNLIQPTERAADAFHAVRDDCLAISRTTQHDAALAFAARDRLGGWPDEHRVIDRSIRIRSKILHVMSEFQEEFLDLFFV